MNWTGGALPRSRNGSAKATLTNLQKKHFAKVRGKLSSTLRSSPEFDTSIFKDAACRPHAKERETSREGQRQSHYSQTKLINYDNLAPTVRKLESLQQRQRPGFSNDRASKDQSTFSAGASRANAHHSVPSLSSRQSSTPSVHSGGMRNEVASTNNFETIRENLLQRKDWVGLAKSKPPKIQFSSARDRELIGKRRQVASARHEPPRIQMNKRRKLAKPLEDLKLQTPYKIPGSSIGNVSLGSGEANYSDHVHLRIAEITNDLQDSGTPDEMLFDRELSIRASTDSRQQLLNSRHSLPQAEQLPRVMHHDRAKYRATPVSLQTSWAGFSSWNESEAAIPYSVHKSTNSPRPEILMHTGDEAVLSAYMPQFETPAWAGVPGLPLMFEDKSDVPVEIYSAADSEAALKSLKTSQGLSTERLPQTHASRSTTAKENKVPSQDKRIVSRETSSNENLPPKRASPNGSAYVRHHSLLKPIARTNSSDCEQARTIEDNTAPERESWNKWKSLASDKSTSTSTGQVKLRLAAGENTQNTSKDTPPTPPRIQKRATTPEDEELIWRKFVFGSEDPHEDWDIAEPKAASPPPNRVPDNSSTFTEPTPKSIKSSILAQASSTSDPTAAASYSSSSPDQLSVLAQPSVALSPHTLPSSQSPRPSHTVLPKQPSSKHHNPPASSLPAQAYTSASTPRVPNTMASFSPDELASTPTRPTIVFRKPSRYVPSGADLPWRIQLGGLGARKRRRSNRRVKEVEIWEDRAQSGERGKDQEQRGDEIIDDDDDDDLA